jgi:hypothetical protein
LSQVLRQLSAEPSYRSLVALGITGVEGSAVAAFKKDDALILASSKFEPSPVHARPVPDWFKPPVATKSRVNLFQPKSVDDRTAGQNGSSSLHKDVEEGSSSGANRSENQTSASAAPANNSEKRGLSGKGTKRSIANLAPLMPIPQKGTKRPNPFAAVVAAAQACWSMKVNLPNGTSVKMGRPPSTSVLGQGHNSVSSGLNNYTPSITPSSLLLAANAPMVKPHGCSRQPIDDCAEVQMS